jgi:hypothetical protein
LTSTVLPGSASDFKADFSILGFKITNMDVFDDVVHLQAPLLKVFK